MIFHRRMLALAMLATAAPALAQQPEAATIARLTDVHGNVLVSKSSGLAAGIDGSRLAEGARVITTNGSDVLVVYDDGCKVHVKANQRFQVDRKPCELLVAQPESILMTPAGAAATATASGLTVYGVLLPALGATGVAALVNRRDERVVSPS